MLLRPKGTVRCGLKQSEKNVIATIPAKLNFSVVQVLECALAFKLESDAVRYTLENKHTILIELLLKWKIFRVKLSHPISP